MTDAPHHQAAFINAIREDGTKAEACDWLQKTWNELCEARKALALRTPSDGEVPQLYRWREKGAQKWKYSDVTPDKDDRHWNEIHDMEPLYARPQGMEVKVKPLEWIGDEAATPFGRYHLYRTDDGWGLSFNDDELVHVGFNSVGAWESPRKKAMSYAQPQYSAAILSALTPGKE